MSAAMARMLHFTHGYMIILYILDLENVAIFDFANFALSELTKY